MIKIKSRVIVLAISLFLGYLIVLSFTQDEAPIAVPAQQFPIRAFEAAKNPLYQYGLVKPDKLEKSTKVYKSVIPLHADGRYEIKGGELDWKFYSFNGEIDVSGEGVDGIAGDVEFPDDFPIEAAKLTVKYFDNLKTGCYALLDLNANGIDEIIVQSGYGSSGAQYAFLEKQNGKWRVIEGFAGGFVLTSLDLMNESKKRYSGDYWYVTHWWSSGNDFVQIIDAYRNREYETVSSQSVPYAVRELDFGRINSNASCK